MLNFSSKSLESFEQGKSFESWHKHANCSKDWKEDESNMKKAHYA